MQTPLPYALTAGTATIAIIIFLPAILSSSTIAYADHSATTCNITIHAERHPITYLNESRQNPDGTFYPGDGFYYLIRYKDTTNPGDCALHAPTIKSGNLHLNYTGVYRGEQDASESPVKVGTPVTHIATHDLIVDIIKTNHYHLAKLNDTCRHHCTWQNCPYLFYHHYILYDKPFLSKKEKITEAEKKAARGIGGATTDTWVANDWNGGSPRNDRKYCDMSEIRNLPVIDFDSGINGETDAVNRPTYTWEIVKNATKLYNNNFTSFADPDSRKKFDMRVDAMCSISSLEPDSGCVYGTAEIKPHARQVCIYENLKSRGINITAPPQSIAAEQYVIPKDACGAPTAAAKTTNNQGTAFDFIIKGTYLTPHHTAGGINPLKAVKTVTKDFAPPLHNTTLQVILTKPPLRHNDGAYEAKNSDGTYYHNDPIQIRHEPSWKWKDERHRHINFTVERLHTVLPSEDSFHCITGNAAQVFPCSHWARLPAPDAWLNETITYGNGDGTTIHNATVHFEFGEYDFAYEMTAHNINRAVAHGSSSTNAVVVAYNPVYEMVYSYPVLKDGAQYAYDDRRGIVMKYAGSWQDGIWPHTSVLKVIQQASGSGNGTPNKTATVPSTPYAVFTDDANATEKVLWPQRRSLLNGWASSNIAYDLYGDPVEFVTSEAHPHMLSEARNLVAAAGNATNASHAAASLQYTDSASSAMFAQSGYGVMVWEWPISDYIFGGNEGGGETGKIFAPNNGKTGHAGGGAMYENASSRLDIYSVDFAGIQKSLLYQSMMRYTDAAFAKQIIIRSIDQRGITQDNDTITLRAVPSHIDADGNKSSSVGIAEYMTDYIYDKVMHDTNNDHTFADAVVSDTYSMHQEWQSNTGLLNATVLRTSMLFDDFTVSPQMIKEYRQYINAFWGGDENQTAAQASEIPRQNQTAEPPPTMPWEPLFAPPSPFDAAQNITGSGAYCNAAKNNGNNSQPLSGINDTQTILQLYAANDLESFRLNLPYHMGLGVPSPTTLYVSVNNGSERALGSKYYAFGGLENMTINIRKDNTATVERDFGRLIIFQPENFGMVKKVKINNADTMDLQNCAVGCTVLTHYIDVPVHVTLYNEWGGEAHAYIKAPAAPAKPAAEQPKWWIVATIAAGLALLYAAYVQIKKIHI